MNESNIYNKITIDDRDYFNMLICKMLKKLNNTLDNNEQVIDIFGTDNQYKEIYDFTFYNENLNLLIKNVNLMNKVIYNTFYDFNNELISKIKNLFRIYSKINRKKEHSLGNDYILKKKNLIQECKVLKENICCIGYLFMKIIKENLHFKDDSGLHAFDIVYLYLFNPKQLTNAIKNK